MTLTRDNPDSPIRPAPRRSDYDCAELLGVVQEFGLPQGFNIEWLLDRIEQPETRG